MTEIIVPENITWIDARNPKYINTANTLIELEVNFEHIPEQWVTCMIQASGDLPHIHQLWNETVNGDYGTIAAFEAEVITGDQAILVLRGEVANKLLEIEQEWDMNNLTTEQTTYKTALNNLVANHASANVSVELHFNDDDEDDEVWTNVTWPTKPS